MRYGRGARPPAGRAARRALHGRRAGLSDGAGRRRRAADPRGRHPAPTIHRAARAAVPGRAVRPAGPARDRRLLGRRRGRSARRLAVGRRAAGERTPLPARPGGRVRPSARRLAAVCVWRARAARSSGRSAPTISRPTPAACIPWPSLTARPTRRHPGPRHPLLGPRRPARTRHALQRRHLACVERARRSRYQQAGCLLYYPALGPLSGHAARPLPRRGRHPRLHAGASGRATPVADQPDSDRRRALARRARGLRRNDHAQRPGNPAPRAHARDCWRTRRGWT